jgi:serine/threonine protein kinase
MPIRSGDIVDGKYCVGRMLGSGGMGIVMEARHIDLDVPRAIKVMRSAMDERDPNAEERFRREARAAASLTGEHVAHVYDVGILPSGERYIVMEYLTGINLQELVRERGALPVRKAVTYLRQACAGIAEAHKQGILHRDIKSSNLFLMKRGLVKVIDWGLAKQILNGETCITASNCMVGSLDYISPEQINSCAIDVRSDIWSLGVVLYELVTGKLPFSGVRCEQIINNILRKQPISPSQIQPDVPLAIDAIVKRCLYKDPDRRYRSVNDLADALRSALSSTASMGDTSSMDSGILERIPSTFERKTVMQRPSRRELTESRRPKVASRPENTESRERYSPKTKLSGRTTTVASKRSTRSSTTATRAAVYLLSSVVSLWVLSRIVSDSDGLKMAARTREFPASVVTPTPEHQNTTKPDRITNDRILPPGFAAPKVDTTAGRDVPSEPRKPASHAINTRSSSASTATGLRPAVTSLHNLVEGIPDHSATGGVGRGFAPNPPPANDLEGSQSSSSTREQARAGRAEQDSAEGISAEPGRADPDPIVSDDSHEGTPSSFDKNKTIKGRF